MKRIQKSRLFFMELMVCILFFSVCSAICLGVFARAHQLSSQSAAMTQALLRAESAAEVYKASDGDLEATTEALDGAILENGAAVVWYDEEWEPCGLAGSTYVLAVEETDGDCPTARVSVYEWHTEELLCELDAAVHTEKEAAS